MAQDFIRSAAHGLLMAFRFTQNRHHTAELPVVLIPLDAWPDFCAAALRELNTADLQPRVERTGNSVTAYGIRFQPAVEEARRETAAIRPLFELQGDWTGHAGGEKHTPRPVRASA